MSGAQINRKRSFQSLLKIQSPVDTIELTLAAASPFHYNWTDPKTELLDPAIIGTTSILKAIKKSAPGVKRVVITSSFASILSAATIGDPTKTFSEADWNPNTYEDGLKSDKAVSYRVSKTIAEKSAWKFVEEEKPNFDLATICPPLVFGPVVHHLNSLSAINTSNARVVDLIQGKWKSEIAPSGVFFWVDVRDVAAAHVAALERPEAGGKRFFTTAGKYSNREIFEIVLKNFPELKENLPGLDVKGGGYTEQGPPGYDNSRATKELGINWIPLEKSIVDTVKSFKEVEA